MLRSILRKKPLNTFMRPMQNRRWTRLFFRAFQRTSLSTGQVRSYIGEARSPPGTSLNRLYELSLRRIDMGRKPIVSIIMGSKTDWSTMKVAAETLDEFSVSHETKIVSAHRTPDLLFDFARSAESRGIEVIIAGAGGAAHLPGMCASQTVLPVLGVPVESKALKGLDSLLSIAQMPAGVPVGTLAIGEAGAKNAALLAVAILGISRPELRRKLHSFRSKQTKTVLKTKLR